MERENIYCTTIKEEIEKIKLATSISTRNIQNTIIEKLNNNAKNEDLNKEEKDIEELKIQVQELQKRLINNSNTTLICLKQNKELKESINEIKNTIR